jgi:hypothetical protein
MIAKHRNGSIENVRLKLDIRKFDNLEDHSGNYDDLPSSMNQDDNLFKLKVYPRHMKHLGVILMMMTTTVTCLLEIIKSLFFRLFL